MLSGMAQGHVSIEKIDICLKMSTLEWQGTNCVTLV